MCSATQNQHTTPTPPKSLRAPDLAYALNQGYFTAVSLNSKSCCSTNRTATLQLRRWRFLVNNFFNPSPVLEVSIFS